MPGVIGNIVRHLRNVTKHPKGLDALGFIRTCVHRATYLYKPDSSVILTVNGGAVGACRRIHVDARMPLLALILFVASGRSGWSGQTSHESASMVAHVIMIGAILL